MSNGNASCVDHTRVSGTIGDRLADLDRTKLSMSGIQLPTAVCIPHIKVQDDNVNPMVEQIRHPALYDMLRQIGKDMVHHVPLEGMVCMCVLGPSVGVQFVYRCIYDAYPSNSTDTGPCADID